MTVPFPLDAFDHDQSVRVARPARDRSKLISIVLTVAFHGVILAGALTAVHVTQSHAPQELSVSIAPQKIKPPEDLAPPPRMVQPATVSVPMPEVQIQAAVPPPVTAQPPAAKSAPAPVATQPSPVAGEGKDAFLGRLLGQLNHFKQYPNSARKAHIEGVVMLHFIMDADGRVTSFEIAKSSGRPILDAEALALIQRAQPLPAIPASYPTRTLDAIVPIEFYLDR
jgi:TonB family protein